MEEVLGKMEDVVLLAFSDSLKYDHNTNTRDGLSDEQKA